MIWHVSPPTSVALNCPLQDEQMVRFRVPMFFCQKWYIVNGAVPPALNKKLNWTRMFWNVLRLILFCQQKMGLVFFQCSVCCFGKLWRWQPAANKTHVEKKLLSADMVGGTSVNLTYGDTVVPSWSNRGTSGFEIKKGSWLDVIDVILSWVIFFFCWGDVLRGWVKVVMATNGLFVDYESSESRWKSDSKLSTSPQLSIVSSLTYKRCGKIFEIIMEAHAHTRIYI